EQIRGAPAWLRRCMERLLDEGADGPLRLGELAAEAGVHPVSLARAFRRQYGLSPGQLQRRAQLNRAAALLRRGLSPAAAALDCGFADQSHFTRAFRAEYRCTPAAWQAGFKTF
ncbi:MAG TPA: AraC family transcriptional regulator, partial [Roseateles sp.]|nr:AraC family transcriptional regulator [Roseateles sp.]